MVQSVSTIPVEKFREMAKSLLAKTRAGQVHWVRDHHTLHLMTDPGFRGGTYRVMLPDARIVLRYVVPRAEPNYLVLQLETPEGVVVESWRVEDPEREPGQEDPAVQESTERDWELLNDLLSEVFRRVTGSDRVLSVVERALASDAPIGRPTPNPVE
jgi:hypothetical protein